MTLAKSVGLDLSKVTPDLLEALAATLSPKLVPSGKPPDDWAPFFKLKPAQAKNFAELLHRLAHTIGIAVSEDCQAGVSGVILAVLFGWDLAIAMVENTELNNVTGESSALANYRN